MPYCIHRFRRQSCIIAVLTGSDYGDMVLKEYTGLAGWIIRQADIQKPPPLAEIRYA